jgi:hypothetical protein
MKNKRSKRSTDELTTLDEFLAEEGRREKFEAVASKEAQQLRERASRKRQSIRETE